MFEGGTRSENMSTALRSTYFYEQQANYSQYTEDSQRFMCVLFHKSSLHTHRMILCFCVFIQHILCRHLIALFWMLDYRQLVKFSQPCLAINSSAWASWNFFSFHGRRKGANGSGWYLGKKVTRGGMQSRKCMGKLGEAVSDKKGG